MKLQLQWFWSIFCQQLDALKTKGYDKLKGTGKKELGKYKLDELITNLLLYRQTEKLLSDFIAGFYKTQVKKYGKIVIRFPKCPHPIIKRVGGEFNQYRTLSGRFKAVSQICNSSRVVSRMETDLHSSAG